MIVLQGLLRVGAGHGRLEQRGLLTVCAHCCENTGRGRNARAGEKLAAGPKRQKGTCIHEKRTRIHAAGQPCGPQEQGLPVTAKPVKVLRTVTGFTDFLVGPPGFEPGTGRL